MRTSIQYTSFFVTLLSAGVAYVLVQAIPQGAGVQLAFAAGCVVATAFTLLIGARVISKDVAGS
jgi:hypothetical protein